MTNLVHYGPCAAKFQGFHGVSRVGTLRVLTLGNLVDPRHGQMARNDRHRDRQGTKKLARE